MIRAAFVACVLALVPGIGMAGSSSLSSGSTAGHLDAPSYNVVGKTAATRVTTIVPRRVIAPAGAQGATHAADDPLLIERRLDCFSTALAPDRDNRNRFLSRCPGNSR